MTTFDGWESRLTGDAMALPYGQLSENTLMHFRTKGSKNGVRRYQMPDGTWTPLGLRERKAREGWGESRRGRKAARAESKEERRAYKAEKKRSKIERKLEKRTARKERRAAKAEKKRLGNVKRLTDEELQKKIARVKMELEYKDLTRSPAIKTAEKVVESIMKSKEAKLERAAKLAEIEAKRKETEQKMIAAKAALAQARGNILDTVLGGSKRKEAKTKLINAKADKTIRGAVRGAISKVISKEGNRIVGEMGDRSIVMRFGRKLKSLANKPYETLIRNMAVDSEEARLLEEKKRRKRDREIGEQLRG